MTIGYNRQSVADIINGANITAPPLNAEFNAIADAFNGLSGHTHTGSVNDGAKIPLSVSVTGYLLDLNGGVGGRNNTTAVTDPTSISDSTVGYSVGSVWINTSTNRTHICQSNQGSNAVWFEVAHINHLSQFLPKVTNNVDIGSSSLQYKNIYIDGVGYIDTIFGDNIDLTGGLNVAGTSALTTATISGSLTANGTANLGSSAVIGGGTVDNTVIGSSTANAITGTVITASTNFVGNVQGNITGTVTGNTSGTHTGPVTGDVTSTGTSGFQNVNISGSLNMDASTTATIINLSTPVNVNDASTKGYTDTKSPIASPTFTGTPQAPTPTATDNTQKLATTQYVTTAITNLIDTAPANLDTLNELAASLGDDQNFAATMTTALAGKLGLSGGVMTGHITLSGSPVDALHPATKSYADSGDALKLNLSGGTMTGAINTNGNSITGLSAPSLGSDATNKTYVDTFLSQSGGTLTGNINANSNKIINLATPTVGLDATNKNYVDGILGSATSAATSAANAAVSETNSAGSASLSQQWATQTGAPVSGSLYGAKYYADLANTASTDVQQFFGVYHVASTAPTTNIVAGDMWFDTSISQLKIYSNQSVWMDAGSQVNGLVSYKHFIVGTASTGYGGSATDFPSSYDIGFVQVFQNGVLLTPSDYTATNNTSVILSTPANTGDEITISAFGTFQVANTYTQNQVDSLLATRDDLITALEDENLLNLGV